MCRLSSYHVRKIVERDNLVPARKTLVAHALAHQKVKNLTRSDQKSPKINANNKIKAIGSIIITAVTSNIDEP